MKSGRSVRLPFPLLVCSFGNFLAIACLANWLTLHADAADQPSAQSLLRQIGITKGICALPGDNDCNLAIQLARESELTCYVQLPDAEDVESARRRAFDAGLYGTRIFVEQGGTDQLHLASNIADAVIASGSAEAMPITEALRVVHPQGHVILGARRETKP